MHTVLRHFVNAARRGFLVGAIEMVEGTGTFSDGKSIFNGFQDISFCKHHCLAQTAPQRKLGSNR
jgi:hypothetical protein